MQEAQGGGWGGNALFVPSEAGKREAGGVPAPQGTSLNPGSRGGGEDEEKEEEDGETSSDFQEDGEW